MANITEKTQNTAPAAGDYLYLVDDPAGTPADNYIQLSTLSELTSGYAGHGYLSAGPSATDTTISLRSLPAGIAANTHWAVIDPFTSECEVRKVTAVSTLDLTVAALDYDHAAADTVLFIDRPLVNPFWFGAKGDADVDDPVTTPGTDDSTAVSRAITQALALENGVLDVTGFHQITTAAAYDLTGPVTIQGRGWRTGFYHNQSSNTNGYLFRVWKNASEVVIKDMQIRGYHPGTSGGTGTSGKCIMIGNSGPTSPGGDWGTEPASLAEAPHDVTVHNVLFRQGMEAVWAGQYDGTDFGDYGPWNVTISDCHIYDMEHGINLQGTRGSININNVHIDKDGGYAQRGFLITGCSGGVNVNNFTVQNMDAVAWLINSTDTTGKSCADVSLANGYVKDCVNATVQASGSSNTTSAVRLTNIALRSSSTLLINSTTQGKIFDVKMENVYSNGELDISGCDDIHGTNLTFQSSASAPAVDIQDCNNVYLSHFRWVDAVRGSNVLFLNGACANLRFSKGRIKSTAGATTHCVTFGAAGGDTFDQITFRDVDFVLDLSAGSEYGLYPLQGIITNLLVDGCYFDVADYVIRRAAGTKIQGHWPQNNTYSSRVTDKMTGFAGIVLLNIAAEQMTTGLLEAATTAGKVKIGKDVSIRSEKEMHMHIALDNILDCTGFTDLAPGEYNKILFAVKYNATDRTAVEGTAGNSIANAAWGTIPDDHFVIGWLEIGPGAHDWDVDAVTANGGTLYDGLPVDF